MPKRLNKKMIFFYILSLSLLILSRQMRIIRGDGNPFLYDTIHLLRHILLILMLLAWIYSIRLRILQPDIYRYLMIIGLSMCVWFVVRIFKWYYLPMPSFAHRFFWYLYYIPILMIPTLMVLLADFIGKIRTPEEEKRKKLLLFVSLFFIIGVLTNDLHQFMFQFPEGLQNYDPDYHYGILFYIILGWILFLVFRFVWKLIRFSKVPVNIYTKLLPLFVVVLGIVYELLFLTKRIDTSHGTDVVAVICMIIIGILETAILTGMIPSNTQYDTLFKECVDNVWIVDHDYEIQYQSHQSQQFPKSVMIRSEGIPLDLGDKILYNVPISGGRTLWLMDVSRINLDLSRLKEVERSLQGEGDLLRAEVALKEEEAKMKERECMFLQLEKELQEQLSLAGEYLTRAKADTKNWPLNIKSAAVIGAYIKRYSNLFLLKQEKELLTAEELFLSVTETAEYLKLFGLPVAVTGECPGYVSADLILAGYQYLELVIEKSLALANAYHFLFRVTDDTLTLIIQAGIRESFDLPAATRFLTNGGMLYDTCTNNDLSLALMFPVGGGYD